jgi:hypothetical protein
MANGLLPGALLRAPVYEKTPVFRRRNRPARSVFRFCRHAPSEIESHFLAKNETHSQFSV